MQDNNNGSAADGVAAVIIAALRVSVGPNAGPIERNQSLADDLNVDSLEFTALIQEIEDKTGAIVDEKELAKAVTVGDLIEVVERACAAKGAAKGTAKAG